MKHSAINTNYVFNEDEQVFLKSVNSISSKPESDEEWHPINFQWIPVVEMHKKLQTKNQF